MSTTHGIHHITAVAGDPGHNLAFYNGLLGLPLVKKTVNYDDPSSYHLFYGCRGGEPGTLLSFLASPDIARGEPDVGQAIAVSLSIPVGSVDFWNSYLDEEGLEYMEPFERFGKLVIGLQDPDGLYLELIGDPAADRAPEGRSDGPVPAAHAIRGLHGVTIAEEQYEATGQLLEESFGFGEADRQLDRILYSSGAAFGGHIELIDGAGLKGEPGRGTVHHVAFRAADEDEQQRQRGELKSIGYHLTEPEDRYYFQSVFFHEPGGVLFEVATDGPGFTADEDPGRLGQRLCLPPGLEDRRSLIEAELPPLNS